MSENEVWVLLWNQRENQGRVERMDDYLYVNRVSFATNKAIDFAPVASGTAEEMNKAHGEMAGKLIKRAFSA